MFAVHLSLLQSFEHLATCISPTRTSSWASFYNTRPS